jgi:hypothetical protein
VGKATGQMNVAAPYLYVSKSGATTLECLNMSSEEMESLVQFNLLPNLSKVDTIDVNISDFQDKYDAETLRKYQGMLIRLKDVEFVDANGKATFADITSTNSATDRYILDSEGNRLLVRNSKSADFATNPLPLGRHDIVGVLGFYQTSSTMWQFYLRTIEDVMGEGKKGTKSYPFSVADAIGAQNTGTKGWIEGYIVGAVAPELTTVTSNADIEWKAPTTLDNTLVIADDPECVDYTKCIIVPLPQGSSFRSEANLKTHTNVYKTLLKVNGEFVPDLGMPGVISSGAKGDYALSVGYTRCMRLLSTESLMTGPRCVSLAIRTGLRIVATKVCRYLVITVRHRLMSGTSHRLLTLRMQSARCLNSLAAPSAMVARRLISRCTS